MLKKNHNNITDLPKSIQQAIKDLESINSLLEDYQEKYPFSEHFFLRKSNENNLVTIICSIDYDKAP